MKILIVEDEFDLAKMVRKRMQEAGFETLTASDAQAAVAIARQEKPDLIILDLKLPSGGGISVARIVRTDPGKLASVPIVVLTAVQDPRSKQEIKELGIDAYLEKPYDPDQLYQAVQRAIGRSGSA